MNKSVNETFEIAVIHLHDSDDDIHLTSELRSSLFEIAYVYHFFMRADVGKVTLDSLAINFGEYTLINLPTFAILSDAIGKDDRIKTMADFDFEDNKISIWEQDKNVWNTYLLDDISDAVKKATIDSNFSLETQIQIFKNHLIGKELAQNLLERNIDSESYETADIENSGDDESPIMTM